MSNSSRGAEARPRIRDHLHPPARRRRRHRREGRSRASPRSSVARTGTLVKVETWGRRKLAYDVAKQRRGVYVYLKYVGRRRGRRPRSSATCACSTASSSSRRCSARRRRVDGVTVDPEDVKFERLERRPRTSATSRARSSSAWSMPGAGAGRDARANSATSPTRPGRRLDDARRSEERGSRSGCGCRCCCGRTPAEAAAPPHRRRPPLTRRKRRSSHEPAQHRLATTRTSAGRRTSTRTPPAAVAAARKRVCKFCADKAVVIDYKDPQALKYFISRARQGRSAPHQRQLRPAPAQGDARHQARAQHRAPALHRHG